MLVWVTWGTHSSVAFKARGLGFFPVCCFPNLITNFDHIDSSSLSLSNLSVMSSNTQLLSDSYNVSDSYDVSEPALISFQRRLNCLFTWECWITYAPLLMVKCWVLALTNWCDHTRCELPGAITGNSTPVSTNEHSRFSDLLARRDRLRFYQPHSVGLGWWPQQQRPAHICPPATHHKGSHWTLNSAFSHSEERKNRGWVMNKKWREAINNRVSLENH